MRLVTFADRAGGRVGVARDDGAVADLTAADPRLPKTMLDFARAGETALAAAGAAAARAPVLPPDAIELLAPVPTPAKNIVCVGKNYRDHAREFERSGFDATSRGDEVPDVPVIFTKAPTTVIGPGAAIPASRDPTASVDYEGELALVIGRGGRDIPSKDALGHVMGYTIVNDVTSRTLQGRHRQWFLGKSLDGFCPMGPALVTADEVGDLADLGLVTRVNGEVRQSARLADLIFDVPALIATVSSIMTLEPGDLIATGTPAGVGIGFDPPRFLRPGDVVSITIDRVGELSNPVA